MRKRITMWLLAIVMVLSSVLPSMTVQADTYRYVSENLKASFVKGSSSIKEGQVLGRNAARFQFVYFDRTKITVSDINKAIDAGCGRKAVLLLIR